MVKGGHCSCEGPEFTSQHHMEAHSSDSISRESHYPFPYSVGVHIKQTNKKSTKEEKSKC